MQNRSLSGLTHEAAIGANENFWRKAVRDSPYVQRPSVQERREYSATNAFVKGARWYAIRLLEFQALPTWQVACQTLIKNSRRLLEDSRHAILKTKNTLAFSRSPKRVM